MAVLSELCSAQPLKRTPGGRLRHLIPHNVTMDESARLSFPQSSGSASIKESRKLTSNGLRSLLRVERVGSAPFIVVISRLSRLRQRHRSLAPTRTRQYLVGPEIASAIHHFSPHPASTLSEIDQPEQLLRTATLQVDSKEKVKGYSVIGVTQI